MKMFKHIATGAAMLSIAQMANADVTFHITGSTAFRAATVTAIQQAINGNSTPSPTAADNATATSANNLLWTGSNSSLGNYTIKASFNGSGAGTQLVAGNLAIPFLSSTNTGWPTTIAAAPAYPGNTTDNVVPDAAMSDVFQATTGFLGSVKTIISGSNQAHTYTSLGDNKVAIVTFKPMASKTFPQGTASYVIDETGSFNVSSYSLTPQNFTATWGSGSTLLSLYSGNHSDEGSIVYATGRNQDSGTRMTYLAETGYGVNNPVVQYFPTVSSSNTVSAVNEYAITTINGISTGANGNGGESSGSAVRGYLAYPFNASLSNSGTNSAYFMTVLGTSDSSSVATAAIELPYNGTYYSNTAVEEGSFTLWSYEHMFLVPGLSTSNATGNAFALSVKSYITGAAESGLAKAGIPLGVMQVQREIDGGNITSVNY